jgi:hypothetical protein
VGQSKPKYLSTDHDPLFRFHRWLANHARAGGRANEIGSVGSAFASIRRTSKLTVSAKLRPFRL